MLGEESLKVFKETIQLVKKKKEFSQLPDSIVERVAKITKGDVKESRALLRKYFGVFLTNKVFKLKDESVLASHISSKDRDYSDFYKKIFSGVGGVKSIIDIGCGVNGFSYKYLKERLGEVNYLGIEAVGQIVDNINFYFKENNFVNARASCEDVFNLEKVKELVLSVESPKVVFLFQIIDALESSERDFSKKLLGELSKTLAKEDLIVITMPMKSLSGRIHFEAKRSWLKIFLEENFNFEEFFINNERVFLVRKK